MPVATYDAGYAETYGTGADCPERELWRAVLRQAADDLFSSNERIRADAIAFFQGAGLLQVMAYAGIDCSCAPLLRERARAICQQSGRLRRRHPIAYQGRTHTIEE